MSSGPRRRLPFGLVAAVVAISAAIGGGAVALGMSTGSGGETRSAGPPTPTAHAHPDPTPSTSGSASGTASPAHHQHPELAPYEERRADATEDERSSAAALLREVRDTLVAYTDVNAAIAAGYRAPAAPRGPMVHYFARDAGSDGKVLDPGRPEGLVYYTQPAAAPVLLGAFFVAQPGVAAPTPAGELVVWHSHNPSCAGFFATADAPCVDTRRMLHVWTVDEATIVPRRIGQPVAVDVTDHFGAPFGASVRRTR